MPIVYRQDKQNMENFRASRRELNSGNIPVGHCKLSENQDDQGSYTGYFDLKNTCFNPLPDSNHLSNIDLLGFSS